MKYVFSAVLVLMIFSLSNCNSPIEWNEESTAQFKKQCLGQLAEKFKAEDPDAFCDCFVNKMKEEELGMMDMIKKGGQLVKDCGAKIPGEE